MRSVFPWALVLATVVAFGADCGAVTLEPLPPDEPLPEAAPPPRLVRRDAGPSPAAEQAPR
jgi:hypothetical protein